MADPILCWCYYYFSLFECNQVSVPYNRIMQALKKLSALYNSESLWIWWLSDIPVLQNWEFCIQVYKGLMVRSIFWDSHIILIAFNMTVRLPVSQAFFCYTILHKVMAFNLQLLFSNKPACVFWNISFIMNANVLCIVWWFPYSDDDGFILSYR